ncbi:ATP-dependent DNA helicase RecG [Geodia barretti]|uniref:ATP-dependent DNA helicase RecG n=1 Tax=Geodia barretti TaxID=519541 RepID=A0AA35S974_GEOBA|nr:ATP-dependent DNA helicase RecG [Geodia barretti]
MAFQMAILGRRRHRERDVAGTAVQYSGAAVDGFLSELPFTPTKAQVRCIGEALSDMARGTPPMSRLLQGEVGSGKTLVALTAILAAASDHRQSALMAPTEVLAEQHFVTVGRLLLRRPFTVGLLTGSTRAAPRREVLRLASEGHLDLLVGTHALIQDGVELPNLALAITDEQHRFGVAQRTALRGAGPEQPHALMMSATPIPRTLQLTLYGDLDVSTIDELPPGRQDILTRLVPEDKRQAAYRFIRQQVEAGRQAFIICPLVEESENLDVRAATEEHQRLSNEVFPDLNLGLLHGRLSSRQKDQVMRQFRDGDLNVLVATAVVEVGIDVPNATVMMIDGADRFGLAQLHQFRGRVGRGEHRSYCLLMSEAESERARERLSALEASGDGFKLAEIDLQMRHEGDIFGTTQSGDQTMLRIASVFDQDLMALARQEAAAILDADPELTDPKHAGIVAERDRFLARVQDNISD